MLAESIAQGNPKNFSLCPGALFLRTILGALRRHRA